MYCRCQQESGYAAGCMHCQFFNAHWAGAAVTACLLASHAWGQGGPKFVES